MLNCRYRDEQAFPSSFVMEPHLPEGAHLPCRYSIDKERRLVINVAWDRLTFPEMRALQEELKTDPNFDRAVPSLRPVRPSSVWRA